MTSSAERDLFDELFKKILGELPAEVQQLLEEVPIVIEDEPSASILNEFGMRVRGGQATLCGLHSGVPLSERSILDSTTLPSQIFLFRGPILRLSGSRRSSLEKQIRITLLHEIGHHFGFSEKKLQRMGYE